MSVKVDESLVTSGDLMGQPKSNQHPIPNLKSPALNQLETIERFFKQLKNAAALSVETDAIAAAFVVCYRNVNVCWRCNGSNRKPEAGSRNNDGRGEGGGGDKVFNMAEIKRRRYLSKNLLYCHFSCKIELNCIKSCKIELNEIIKN